MSLPAGQSNAERVLVLAPLGNDAENVCEVLASAGLSGCTNAELFDVAENLRSGAGCLLLAAEALVEEGMESLQDVLSQQPNWSDIPLLIIAQSSGSDLARQQLLSLFAPHGNVTLIERPLHPITLVSAIQVALRARRKQYELQRFIEEKEAALQRAQEAEQRFRAIFNQQFQFMAILSQDGVVLEINELPCRATGISRADVEGKVFWQTPFWAQLPEMQENWPRRLAAAAQSDGPVVTVDEYSTATGQTRLADAAITAVRDESNNVRFFIVQASDITDRKAAEDALRLSEEKNRLIVENVKDFAIFAFDDAGRVTSWNPGAERVFGYSAAEALGQPIDRFYTDEDRKNSVPAEEQRLATETGRASNERWHLRKDGQRFYGSGVTRPLLDDKKAVHGFIKVLRDVTEQKAAQSLLQRKTRRLETLADVAHALLSADAPDTIAREIFSRLESEFELSVYVNYLLDFGDRLRLDSYAGISAAKAEAIANVTIGEGIGSALCDPAQVCELTEIQQSNAAQTDFLREIGLAAYASFPLLIGGRLIGTLGFGSRSRARFEPEDVEYLHTICNFAAVAQERTLYQRNLERTVQHRTAELQTKVGELEAFSYSVSHDLRSPLRAMQGYAQVLLEDCATELDTPAQDYLRRICNAAKRLDHLVSDILAYSRVAGEVMQQTPLDLETVIQEVVHCYPALQSAHIEVIKPLEPVIAHEPSLMQCFSNLLGNAVKFVPADRSPHVRIWTERRDGFVRIHFKDNGIGIPPHDTERIFKIFEKASQTVATQGTGIGLAIVRKAVERMSGRSGVDSTVGQGSTFWIELPRPL